MKRVERAFYRNADGDEVPLDGEAPAFRMEAFVVHFSCPVCGSSQTHESEPSFPQDERHLCSSCEHDYFMFPVATKEGKTASPIERVEEQLESVAVVQQIGLDDAQAIRELPFTAVYGGTAMIPILLGVASNILLAVGIVSVVGITAATMLHVVLTTVQTGIAFVGALIGPIRYLYNWFLIYHRYDAPDVSPVALMEHVGNYHHKDPYTFD